MVADMDAIDVQGIGFGEFDHLFDHADEGIHGGSYNCARPAATFPERQRQPRVTLALARQAT